MAEPEVIETTDRVMAIVPKSMGLSLEEITAKCHAAHPDGAPWKLIFHNPSFKRGDDMCAVYTFKTETDYRVAVGSISETD